METKQINDPNYVLDERGKAHYLFDKKNSNGEVEKTFRTHSKHHGNGYGSSSDTPPRPKPSRPKATAAASSASASPTPPAPKSTRKRKRRGNRWGGMSDYDEDDSDDLIGYDNDNSGSYTTKVWTTRRTRTRAAALAAENSFGMGGNASEEGGSSNFEDTIEDEDDVAGWGVEKRQLDNPLPGFIDPITLDEVIKPAISKYGHVMGYVILN